MNAPTPGLRDRVIAAIRGSDAEQAHALASELARTQPDNCEYRQMAGVTALSTERIDEAMEHFQAAVRHASQPAFAAAAWTGLGRARLLAEDAPQARRAFRRALSLIHEFPPALAGLALALAREERYEEAERAARRALELGVDEARLHVALGYALLGLDKLDQAETEFRCAQSMDPAAAEPRFGLGTLAKLHGRFEEAGRIYREVLEDMPEFPGYSQLAALKTFTAEDSEITRIEQRLASLEPSGSRSVRSDLHFALAKVYDDIGATRQATEHLRVGNALERERLRYDPGGDEARMQRITELFTRGFIGRFEDAGMRELRPIFVISLPRSGSTLTEQMLASHSRVRGGGELGHFARVATALSLKWGARSDFPDIEPTAARNDLRELAREYSQLTGPLRLMHPYFTDKSLNNFLYVGLIRMMLPDARIVHVRRHPLATVLGIYRQRFTQGLGYSADLDHIVRYYRAYSRLMEHWRNTIPEAYIEVRYESLVADAKSELRRIFEYVGLALEAQCMEFYRLDRPVRTASATQVRKPLDRLGIGRHEHYRNLLAPASEALREEIASYEA